MRPDHAKTLILLLVLKRCVLCIKDAFDPCLLLVVEIDFKRIKEPPICQSWAADAERVGINVSREYGVRINVRKSRGSKR